jgi:hypothetical protein
VASDEKEEEDEEEEGQMRQYKGLGAAPTVLPRFLLVNPALMSLCGHWQRRPPAAEAALLPPYLRHG